MTPPGIDSGTVRLVAQLLNHYATTGLYTQRVILREFKNFQLYFLYIMLKHLNEERYSVIFNF